MAEGNGNGSVFAGSTAGLQIADRLDAMRAAGAMRRRRNAAVRRESHHEPSPALAQAWTPIAAALAAALEPHVFATWIATCHPHSYRAATWTIATPPTCSDWIAVRFGALFQAHAGRVRFVVCKGPVGL